MSFSDEDKEALGEDLDDLKIKLDKLHYEANLTRKHIGTLVTITWVLLISGFIGLVALIVLFQAGN